MDIISNFKRAVRAKDLHLIAGQTRDLAKCGVTPSGIYRMALAGDPSLTMDQWTDLLASALETHND